MWGVMQGGKIGVLWENVQKNLAPNVSSKYATFQFSFVQWKCVSANLRPCSLPHSLDKLTAESTVIARIMRAEKKEGLIFLTLSFSAKDE